MRVRLYQRLQQRERAPGVWPKGPVVGASMVQGARVGGLENDGLWPTASVRLRNEALRFFGV